MVPRTEATRGVFGPFGGHFSDRRFRLDPGKFLAIREFHVACMNVSSFQCARARGSTCCESGRLCAQAWQRRWEKLSEIFSIALFHRSCFRARGRRSSRCRISAILVSSESLCHLLSKRYRPCTEGGQFDPAFGLVNGPVKPWSNLVKVGQTSPNSGKCAPGLRPEVLMMWWVPSRVRKRLGQTLVQLGQTSVKLGQPRSNLVKLWEMRPKPSF
uniref:Uncharacterized protein n=1 Tax=Fagus sylvatica TaxID=28930 RepID=A0A2N9FWR1_FAGSY